MGAATQDMKVNVRCMNCDNDQNAQIMEEGLFDSVTINMAVY